ncbi:MAG: glycosyltransferase [Bifidobacterium pseudocatenulatum]
MAPNNPQALADAIASLISSPNILARKQSGAAKNAQRFTSDIITRELSRNGLKNINHAASDGNEQATGVMNLPINPPGLGFPRHRLSSTHMGYHQKLESSCSCTYSHYRGKSLRLDFSRPLYTRLFLPRGLGASFLPIWGSPLDWSTATRSYLAGISQIGKYIPGGVWNIVAAAEIGRDC